MIKWLRISLFVLNMVMWAGNDKPIQVDRMPKAAQQFIRNHFADQSVFSSVEITLY